MKRIAMLVLVLAACKTSDSAAPAKTEPAPATDRPTAARPAPALPAAGADTADQPAAQGDRPNPEDRPWRRHGGDRMMKMDTDGDGKVSDEERAAAMTKRAENMRTRMDTNNDGKLSVEEMNASQGRMKFDDPAALDTNKDGDISAAELAAGMQARREANRAKRDAEGGAVNDKQPSP